MNNLFSQLQEAKEKQDQALEQGTSLLVKKNGASKQDAQKIAHKSAQVSRGVSKPLNKGMSKAVSQDAVEELAFRLRKTPQTKMNTTVPFEWKEKFDDLAFRLKVGKYELLTFIVGVFLGEVEQPEP